MATDIAGAPSTGSQSASSPGTAPSTTLPPELLAMLAKGGGGTASLKQLLSMAQLTVELHFLVDLFLSLDDGERDEDDVPVARQRRIVAHDAARGVPADDVDANDADEGDGRSLRELRQELADLREVNDTVAAALGACRACWGGDPGCATCGGRGQAGFLTPDAALFQELVIPAVRRVRDHEREGSHGALPRRLRHTPTLEANR